jgi:thymidine kinase
MIYLVLGPKGSGKTKWLVDQANTEKAKGNENIVFIDTDDDQIFSLDYKVRLINASHFFINSLESFRGFVAGILARDFDIGKVYVDGIYEIVDVDKDNIQELTECLKKLSEECEADIYLGLDWLPEDVPEDLDVEIHETKLVN